MKDKDFSTVVTEAGLGNTHTWQFENTLKSLHNFLRQLTQEDLDIVLSRTIESWMDEMCTSNRLHLIEWKDFKTQMFLAMEKEFKKKDGENA